MTALSRYSWGLRGLVVLLGGILLLGIAVLLETAGEAAGASLSSVVFTAVAAWQTASGSSVAAALAALGLAIAAIGPVWYWLTRPLLAALGWDRFLPRIGRRRSTYSVDTPAVDDDDDQEPDRFVWRTADDDRGSGRSGSTRPDWASTLFEGTPKGDFLRSSSGASTRADDGWKPADQPTGDVADSDGFSEPFAGEGTAPGDLGAPD